jgi:hypothetical protein
MYVQRENEGLDTLRKKSDSPFLFFKDSNLQKNATGNTKSEVP